MVKWEMEFHNIGEVYIESMKYKNDIMSSICNILKENNIEYKTNEKLTEIIIKKQRKSIKKLLQNNIDVPIQVFSCLVGITSSSKNTYIRLIVN